jgi:hypothetical protein
MQEPRAGGFGQLEQNAGGFDIDLARPRRIAPGVFRPRHGAQVHDHLRRQRPDALAIGCRIAEVRSPRGTGERHGAARRNDALGRAARSRQLAHQDAAEQAPGPGHEELDHRRLNQRVCRPGG